VHRRWSWLLSLSLVACASPRTAIVVVVESDLGVPVPLASVHVEAGAAPHDFVLGDGGTQLPFSFGVEPSDPSAGSLSLLVEARDAGGAVLVTRRARVAFRTGHTLVLRVRLDAACMGVPCTDTTTCVAHACVDSLVDASTLPDLVPGHELDATDAGPGTDAGDAGAIDASDAGPHDDAGTAPRACGELPSGSATGVYALDPDGAGGEPPFDAYCEMTADGGGWALIAKVDPLSLELGFDAPAWTAPGPEGSLGSNDTMPGNALRPSYWRLPVRELRFVMRDADGERALVASLDVSSPRILRSTMDDGAGVGIVAGLDAWGTLAGLAVPMGATCVMSGMPTLAPTAAPRVRVRVGVTASLDASCAPAALWAGLGADTQDQAGSCHPVTTTAGGAQVCNPRSDHPAFTLLFAR
jgi:hypothetical protein